MDFNRLTRQDWKEMMIYCSVLSYLPSLDCNKELSKVFFYFRKNLKKIRKMV